VVLISHSIFVVELFTGLGGVSEPVRHALEIVGREIDRQIASLTTEQHAEFRHQLHGYGLIRVKRKARLPLAAADHLAEPIRRALDTIDSHIHSHIERLNEPDRQRFWEVLHEQTERMAERRVRTAGGY
jgi:hypothetical protein